MEHHAKYVTQAPRAGWSVFLIIGALLFTGVGLSQTPTTTALSYSSQKIASGGTVYSLTASVGNAGGAVLVGAVDFLDGGKLLGTAQLIQSSAAGFTPGTAVFRKMLAPGAHSLTARFGGTTALGSSASPVVSMTATGSVTNTGRLYPAGNYPVSSLPIDVTLADINNDGLPDMVVPQFEGKSAAVLLNDAANPGHFIMSQTLQTIDVLTHIVVKDINGDGLPDIVAGCGDSVSGDSRYYEGILFVFLQDAAHPGQFLAPTYLTLFYVVPSTFDVVDIDGDGVPDIVLGGTYYYYGSSGSGAAYFSQQATNRGHFNEAAIVDATPDYFFYLSVADMDGDGLPDVVLGGTELGEADTEDGYSSVRVYYSDKTKPGTFNKMTDFPGPTLSLNTPLDPFAMRVADLNQDGHPDVILGNVFGGVEVLMNDAKNPGSLLPGTIHTVPDRSLGVAAAYITGSGNLDIATGNFSNSFAVLAGDGQGGLGAPTVYGVTPTGSTEVENLASADLDGDGLDDVVLSLSSLNEVAVFLHTPPTSSVPVIPTGELYVSTAENELGTPISMKGLPVTLSAAVLSPTATIPTGTVSFMNGTSVIGQATLDANGHATLVTTTLPAGPDTLSYIYSGDGRFASVTSAGVLVEVIGNVSTLTVSASPATAIAGAPVTLTTIVSGSASVPTGSVSYFLYNNGAAILLQTVPVDHTGTATLTLTTVPVGTQLIDVSYSGDATYGTAGGSVTVVIQPGASLTLNTNITNFVAFVPATFTATLSNTTPIVNVQLGIYDFNNLIATVTTNSSGVAMYQTSTLAAGLHVITARGVVNSTALQFILTNDISNTALSIAPPTPSLNQSVTLTATVTNQSTSVVPMGTVSFTDSGVALGTANLNSTGVATYQTAALSAGTHNFVATYAGATGIATSYGSSTVSVAALPSDYGVAANPNVLTVSAGQSGTVTLTLTPQGGFSDTVQLSCGTLPQYVTCSFASSAVAISGTAAQTVQLKVSTGSATTQTAERQEMRGEWWPVERFAFGWLILPILLGGRFRARGKSIVWIACLSATMLVSGCSSVTNAGSGGTTTPLPPTAAPGTYSIVVNAASQHSSQTHSINLPLTVQ